MACTCSRWFNLMMTHEPWWTKVTHRARFAVGPNQEYRTAPVIDVAVACQLPPLHVFNIADSSSSATSTAFDAAVRRGQFAELKCLRLMQSTAYFSCNASFRRLASATPNLETLILRRLTGNFLTDVDLADCVEGNWPCLTHIDLSLSRRGMLGAITCAAIGRTCLNLTTINLAECRTVNTECLKLLIPSSRLSLLHTLHLDFTTIDDDGLQWIGDRCGPILLHLHIDGCTKVTDAGVVRLFGMLPYDKLQTFCASYCNKIQDASVDAVVERCSRSLRSISLREGVLKGPSPAAIAKMVNCCTALQEAAVLRDRYSGAEGLDKLRRWLVVLGEAAL